ncbi:MAG TPA: hypothetical protein VFS96_07420 [Nitrolancea sp.]|nr:hypothetical protein [Nitrolancea sp.]
MKRDKRGSLHLRAALLCLPLGAVLGCGGTEPDVGAIRLVTLTGGEAADIPGNGYEVTGFSPLPAQRVLPSGVHTVDDLDAGTYSLTLGGIPSNCEVDGGAVREVAVVSGDTAEVSWTLACGLVPGSLVVVFVTPPDASTGSIQVRLEDGTEVTLAAGQSVSIHNLTPSGHTVTVTGGTANCRIVGPPTRAAYVERGATTTLELLGFCSAGRVLFDRTGHLWLMNADGTDLHEVPIPSDLHATFPALSPDGERIAFVVGPGTLYIMHRDGSGLMPIETPPNLKSPVWSPDATRIAFSATPFGGTYDVFIVNADGSGLQNVTDHPARDEDASWNADGTRLAFMSDRAGGPIFTIADDGSDETPIVTGSAYHPAWSPDGSGIALILDQLLKLVTPTGANIPIAGGPAGLQYPRWSSDGRLIVSADMARGILIIDPATGVTTTALEVEPHAEIMTQASWSR